MLSRRLCVVLLFILTGCGQSSTADHVKPTPVPERPDNASALLQWMPANGSAGFILAHPDLVAGMADDLVRVFDGVPSMKLAVEGARSFNLGALRPVDRVWGSGLALDRGVAFFESGKGVRIVFGADALADALASLQGIFTAAGGAPNIDPQAGTLEELKCVKRGAYAVCDTNAIPETAPGVPSAFESDPVAKTTMALVMEPGEGAFSGQLSALPVSHIALTWRDSGASSRITARFDLTGPATMATGFFGGSKSKQVMSHVAMGQSFFKVGLATDRIAPLLGGLLAQMPPAVTLVLQEFLRAWSGDLLITTDGGLLHPVFVLGLEDARRGETLVETWAQALVAICGYPCAEVVSSHRPGLRALRFKSPADADETVTADLHFGVINHALVLTISPADLARRTSSVYRSAQAGAFADGATHGIRVDNPLTFLASPWAREILDFGPLQDISTVIMTSGLFYRDVELRVNTANNALALDLEMRRLPRGGPGRKGFERALRHAALGDAIAAQQAWIDLAAAHPDTPFGLAARSQLGASMAVMVPLVGVLAAVAIPAFVKYISRSKTAEAVANVKRMGDGATAYFERSSPSGALAERHFPPTVTLTPGSPSLAMCPGGDSANYVPTQDTWAHPTWAALGFAVEDPFLYSYEFISEGKGAEARFTARATGDLDCDGVLSTFERIGHVDESGRVVGGAGIFSLNELE